MVDPLQMLSELVQVPGVTGSEGAIIRRVARLCEELELPAKASDDGVLVRITSPNEGPRLLLCSHLDTVAAGDGWTVSPFSGVIQDDKCIGRGTVDARGSGLAMLLAAKQFQQTQATGELIVALSVGEEGNSPSLPDILKTTGHIDAGIVGEPTNMHVATAQRGLMIVDLLSSGEQAHAARAKGVNAIRQLSRDLLRLDAITWPLEDSRLGSIRITPTCLEAGIADNVTPPVAKARLDIRTTPAYSHHEIKKKLSDTLESTVQIVADQWAPCFIDEKHPLVSAAVAALDTPAPFGSDAASDWFALQNANIPAIKIGPGDPTRSHRPDEFITEKELKSGVEGYTKIVQKFFQITSEERR